MFPSVKFRESRLLVANLSFRLRFIRTDRVCVLFKYYNTKNTIAQQKLWYFLAVFYLTPLLARIFSISRTRASHEQFRAYSMRRLVFAPSGSFIASSHLFIKSSSPRAI